MITKVKFLIETDGEGVFAFFTNNWYHSSDHADKTLFQSYAHVGQHSSCHIDYANECKEANFNQYQDLLKELIGIGYKLDILNSQEIECYRKPTESEIKFGEGATHYRSFTIGQIGISKKGTFKSWFISPSDNLRYYTR